MAYPTLRGSTGAGVAYNGANPWTPTLPTHAAGDLLICFASSDKSDDHTDPTGWTRIASVVHHSSSKRAYLWYKIATGASETFSLTRLSSANFAARFLSVRDWFGTYATGVTVASITSDWDNADPSSVTASWGAADNLFITFHSLADGTSNSGYPSNFPDNRASGGTGGGYYLDVAVATLSSTNATENPATGFTATGGDAPNVEVTLVVRPTGGSTAKPAYYFAQL